MLDKKLKKSFKNIFEAYYQNENEEIDGYLKKSTEYIIDYLHENNEAEFCDKLCTRKYKLKG